MKYLFINSVSGFGSTGRLVAEKCRELTAQGHECRIAYGRGEFGHSDIPGIPIGSRMDNLVHAAQSRILDNHGFASYHATRRFLNQVREYDPDVIWLHNLHGYYLHVGLLFDYLRTCGKEIRWTLHDCWAFTGHCSNFNLVGCDRWKTGCRDCPQKRVYPESFLMDRSRKNYLQKKLLFTGIPNLRLIVPSHWLENLVQQSFLGEYPVEVVYHRVDESVFHPTQSDFREKLGIGDKKLILSVSNVWPLPKGLPDLIKLAGMLDASEQLVLIGLNRQQIDSLPAGVIGLSRTASPQELAQAYSAADVYVSASMEETFGLTVLEAAMCGTVPVVYAGTACEEIALQHGGIAVPRGPEHLLAGIRSVLWK